VKSREVEAFPGKETADFVGSVQGHFLLSEDVGKQEFSGKGCIRSYKRRSHRSC
jgi:hypothetical protein